MYVDPDDEFYNDFWNKRPPPFGFHEEAHKIRQAKRQGLPQLPCPPDTEPRSELSLILKTLEDMKKYQVEMHARLKGVQGTLNYLDYYFKTHHKDTYGDGYSLYQGMEDMKDDHTTTPQEGDGSGPSRRSPE